ncbi:MAG: Hpt domain-containing protein [Fidelibacterota bacterium]
MAHILDIERLEKLKSIGGSELLSQMLNLYLENAPDRIAGITEGYAAGDFDRVKKSAHSLKSSSGNVGAMDFMIVCQDIETAAERGDREALESLMTSFPVQAQNILTAVRQAKESADG